MRRTRLNRSMRRLRGMAPLALLLVGGCSAQRVLYRPTAEERKLLDEPPLGLTVNVVHWDSGAGQGKSPVAYGRGIASLVEKSDAFTAVTYDPSRATVSDLTVESRGEYCNSAIIPLLTIVTVGVLPTIWEEKQCDGAVFRRAGAPRGSDSVVVRVGGKGTALMGWLAAPLGLLPGWEWRTGRDQSGYRDAFRLAVIAKRAELERLARVDTTR